MLLGRQCACQAVFRRCRGWRGGFPLAEDEETCGIILPVFDALPQDIEMVMPRSNLTRYRSRRARSVLPDHLRRAARGVDINHLHALEIGRQEHRTLTPGLGVRVYAVDVLERARRLGPGLERMGVRGRRGAGSGPFAGVFKERGRRGRRGGRDEGRLVADEVVMDVDVGLATDKDIGTSSVAVGEVVEGEDYGAVGRVFEGDDGVGDFFPLDHLEDGCSAEEVNTMLVRGEFNSE
jgi:hypothetical protein